MPTPRIPFLVSGTVLDGDSAAVTSQQLRVINSSEGSSFIVVTTDSSGRYVADLANLGYSDGDTIIIRSTGGGYIGENSFTLSGEGGTTLDITVRFFGNATIRHQAWLTLRNHLKTGTYAISTSNIYSSMNDKLVKTVGYPFVIIEPPKVDNTSLTINEGDARRRTISFMIRVYHTSSKEMKILQDEIEDKITTGEVVLTRNRLRKAVFPEGDYEFYTDGDQTIHVGLVPVIFKLISDV